MKGLGERIRDLLDYGWDYDEIVEELGCSREYVRATASRKRYGRSTPGDRAHSRRQNALLRQYGDAEAANAARRKAYKALRLKGRTPKEANSLSSVVYQRVLHESVALARREARS